MSVPRARSRKPSAVARELLRNFPKAGGKRRRRKRKGGSKQEAGSKRNGPATKANGARADEQDVEELDLDELENGAGAEEVDEELQAAEAADES